MVCLSSPAQPPTAISNRSLVCLKTNSSSKHSSNSKTMTKTRPKLEKVTIPTRTAILEMWAHLCLIRARVLAGAVTMKRYSTFSMETCLNVESRNGLVTLTSLLHRQGVMDKEFRILCLLTMASLEMTLALQRLPITPKQELTNLWQVNTRRPVTIQGPQPMASMPRLPSPKVA